jgi:hypothetical protein
MLTLRELLEQEAPLENYTFPEDFREEWLDMHVAAFGIEDNTDYGIVYARSFFGTRIFIYQK